jgi:hypothetical protein
VQLVTAGQAVMLTQTTLQQEVVLDQIGRSVKAGDVLGKLKLTDDFGNVKELDLVAAADAATDMTTEYLTMTGLSLGSLAVLAVISTLLRKRKTH